MQHLASALWLILALPKWYFQTIARPLGAGYLSAVPAVGILCLAAGVFALPFQRSRSLLLFVIPFLATELYVGIAGWCRGLLNSNASNYASLAFLILQIALIGYCFWAAKRTRLSALLLSLFCAIYTLFALFVASMAFTDSWL